LHFVVSNQKNEEKLSSSSSPASVESENSDEILDGKLPAEKIKLTFSCSSFEAGNELVLLPSAIVRFQCGEKSGFARVLLDSCSQPSLVSDVFVRKFKIPCHESKARIKGVSVNSVGCSSAVKLSLYSRKRAFVMDIEADIVPAHCLSYSAAVSFPAKILQNLESPDLAEPALVNPGEKINSVDIVIGAKYYEDCMLGGTMKIDTLTIPSQSLVG